MQEEHGELGEEMEEEVRVTRTSARLGRNQEIIEQGAAKRAADDEIIILETNVEAFGEEEESKYAEACKRKKCIVRIVRIKETEISNSTEDLVKQLLDQILKNIVDEHMLKACLVI